jgi:hypothetical protein
MVRFRNIIVNNLHTGDKAIIIIIIIIYNAKFRSAVP